MLEGFKVVELATDVAGPSAAAGLAEWDAGVIIKVERRAGDPTARAQGCSVFEFEGRVKRGIVLRADPYKLDPAEVRRRVYR